MHWFPSPERWRRSKRQKEFENLRQYIDRGGFIVVDDFDGERQLDNFRRQLAEAFPDRSLDRLHISHPIFNTFYSIESLETFDPYVPGGEPVFYGLNNKDGTLAIVACHNNDLQNFWDWIGTASYPLRPSSEAFRMGVNFTILSDDPLTCLFTPPQPIKPRRTRNSGTLSS